MSGHAHITALLGAFGGAALGFFAGPPGVAVGCLFGGIVGATAATVLDGYEVDVAQHARRLEAGPGVPNDSLPILLQRRLPAEGRRTGTAA